MHAMRHVLLTGSCVLGLCITARANHEGEADSRYVAGFDAPERIYVEDSDRQTFSVTSTLSVGDIPAESSGAQAWLFEIRVDGADIIEAEFDGTVAADAPEGLWDTGWKHP
jgi:hypothetical protein